MKPKTINEAILACSTKYYPDDTCPHGHDQSVVGKYLSGGRCVACCANDMKNYRADKKRRIAEARARKG